MGINIDVDVEQVDDLEALERDPEVDISYSWSAEDQKYLISPETGTIYLHYKVYPEENTSKWSEIDERDMGLFSDTEGWEVRIHEEKDVPEARAIFEE